MPFCCPAGSEPAPFFPQRGGCFLARRVRSPSLLARPRSLRAETPPAATRQRVRGRGPLGIRIQPRHRHPSPDPHAGSPQPAERWPLAPAGQMDAPHPQISKSAHDGTVHSWQHGWSGSAAKREGGGELRPAGGRSHGAGARGHRAAKPAGGDAGPDRASHAEEGNSEGPHAGLCLLGRTQRRVGGLGSKPSPSDRSGPAGQSRVTQ